MHGARREQDIGGRILAGSNGRATQRSHQVGEAACREGVELRASLALLAVIGLAAGSVSGADDAGVFSAAQAQRGAALYDAHCAPCHGVSLQGASAIALSGATFQARWADGHHSVDDLFYIIRTLMPNNEPGSLARPQYLDIVTYILSVNGWTAGDHDLPLEAARLKALTLGRSSEQQ